MPGTLYQLTMSVGPNPGTVFTLEKAEIVIGRDAANDIVINDLEVSRKHAHLIAQQGGYLLEDLGSTNGTDVDDIRLTSPHILLVGEVISLGEHVKLIFGVANFDPEATQVSVPVASASVSKPVVVATPQAPAQPFMPSPIPQPSFSGQVPLNPVSPRPIPEKNKIPLWVIILIVIILVIILSCVGFFLFVDANSLWCTFFPFISGCP